MQVHKESALIIKNLYKDFKLPHDRKNSLKESIISFKRNKYENFHVLKDINLDIKKGDFFGIVGRNGSGKSTLLKIIGGIYQPTKGSVQVNGSLTPFIELGIGFNPELTGKENVFLNGAILGLTHKEIENKYNEIVEFAELSQFMDQKLKNYSSGMQVRLAFSIAIRAHNDILLIDEVLAVGDANFQKKCFDFFKQLKKDNKTVIFVTHDMGAIEQFCNRAMMIDEGKAAFIGNPTDVALQYELANMPKTDSHNKISLNEGYINNVEINSKNGYSEPVRINLNEDIIVKINFDLKEAKSYAVGINFTSLENDIYVGGYNTAPDLGEIYPTKLKNNTATCKIKANQLASGLYNVNVGIYNYEDMRLLDCQHYGSKTKLNKIYIKDNYQGRDGYINLSGGWEIKK